MKNQVLVEIKDSLDKMEKIGIDMTILQSLDKLRQLLKERKARWLDVQNSDGFYFYQAIRNLELILGKMEHRFKNSQKSNDNPKIAEDSLELLPSIENILNITSVFDINDQTINRVLKDTQHLRNVASNTNLIESLETSRESIDKDQLKLQYAKLMKNLNIMS